MKTTSLNTETDNLVLFPSAKNFVPDERDLQDPMADLLNEYSHLSDADIPDYLDTRYEEEESEEEAPEAVYDSLDAYMTRNFEQDGATSEARLIKLIGERMQAITEAKARIKFYLDEIEMFLPRRR